MSEFEPRVYFDDDQRLVIDLMSDGQIVVIDDVIPDVFRFEAFHQDAFERFFHGTFPLWLVDDRYLDRVASATKQQPRHILWSDHIDLEHYGLVRDDVVQTGQVRSILSLVAEYWDYRVLPGLLFCVFKSKISQTMSSELLARLADLQTKQFDLSRLADIRTDFHDTLRGQLNQLRAPGEVAKTKIKVGRNDPCPCGSGKKFKKCCGAH